jgi:hypothetical protein
MPITTYNPSVPGRSTGKGENLRAGPPRTTAESRRARVCAFSACVLVSAAVVSAALVPVGATAAPQQEPPPPTTTTPAPDPAPAPVPAPTPKPKPAPRPAPKPASPPPQQSQPAPTPVQPVQQTPVVRQSPAVTKPVVKKPVVKKNVHRAKPKPQVKPEPVVPRIEVPKPVGASAGLPSAVRSATGGAAGIWSLLIVMGLALAITCFAVAVIPATAVPWRPAAIFVSERQVDLTVVGLALLMAASFTLIWTGM